MVEVRNNGVPLIDQAPRASITQALSALAENLTGEKQKPAAEGPTPAAKAAPGGNWLSFLGSKAKSK
jgi:pilus assembly protein CpaE